LRPAVPEARRTPRAALAADGHIPRTVPGPLSGPLSGSSSGPLPGSIATGPRWLDDLLAADMGDAGCELTFVHLDRYAEAQLSGHEPRLRFRGVAVHLRSCPACHEDLTGLLLAFRPQDLPDS